MAACGREQFENVVGHVIPTPTEAIDSHKGGEMANPEQTSPKVASKAAKILADPKSSKAVKAVAASDLAQTKKK